MRDYVTEEARAEAARRWGDRRTSDRLPIDWLNEGMASGFVLGAQWAAARAETTTTEPCPDHKPAQHRDGKPPWCPRCGLTAAMTEPVARFKRGRAETATEATPEGRNYAGEVEMFAAEYTARIAEGGHPMTADHAAIRARLDAANDDIGIAYSIPADEWVLTCDKPTMVFLRYAQDDMAALFEEIDRLDRNDLLWHEWFNKARSLCLLS